MATKDWNETGFFTKAVHAGQAPDKVCGAVMTPIYQTSTFAQPTPGEPIDDYDYARGKNPTRTALEANLAALEGGKYGLSYSSGLASIAAVAHLLQAGDHVLLGDDVYGGTFRLFDKCYKRFGIEFSMVDMTDLEKTEAALQKNTKLVWLETPTNPTLKVLDIAALSKLAHSRNAIVGIDNTFASPYLQQPLSLGADIVCHSTTKYIGGHSDLIGGALITNNSDLYEKLKFTQFAVGAVPSPHECFLLLRSTKTLGLRMERHCENARKIAAFLEDHSKIERVFYPGLESHPQHEIAKRQMKDFGGMITVIMKGGLAESRSFLEKVQIFLLAESLGGVESLIEHPAIMTHASVPKEQREELGITDGLVRLSVGIEDVEDLIEDLTQALG